MSRPRANTAQLSSPIRAGSSSSASPTLLQQSNSSRNFNASEQQDNSSAAAAAAAASSSSGGGPPRSLTPGEAQSVMTGGSTLQLLLDNPQMLASTSTTLRREVFANLFFVIADSRSVFTSGVRHDSADAMALLTLVLNPRGQFCRTPVAAELATHIASNLGLSGLKRLRLDRHIMSNKEGVAPAAVAFITALMLASREITPQALLGGNNEAEVRFASMSSSFSRGRDVQRERHRDDGNDPDDPLIRGPSGTRRAGNTDIRVGGPIPQAIAAGVVTMGNNNSSGGGASPGSPNSNISNNANSPLAALAAAGIVPPATVTTTAGHRRSSRHSRYAQLPTQPLGNISPSSNPAYVRGANEVTIELAPPAVPAAVKMHARAFGLGGRSTVPKMSQGADMAKRKCLVLKLLFPGFNSVPLSAGPASTASGGIRVGEAAAQSAAVASAAAAAAAAAAANDDDTPLAGSAPASPNRPSQQQHRDPTNAGDDDDDNAQRRLSPSGEHNNSGDVRGSTQRFFGGDDDDQGTSSDEEAEGGRNTSGRLAAAQTTTSTPPRRQARPNPLRDDADLVAAAATRNESAAAATSAATTPPEQQQQNVMDRSATSMPRFGQPGDAASTPRDGPGSASITAAMNNGAASAPSAANNSSRATPADEAAAFAAATSLCCRLSLLERLFVAACNKSGGGRVDDAVVETGPCAVQLSWSKNNQQQPGGGRGPFSASCCTSAPSATALPPLLRRGHPVPTFRVACGHRHSIFLVGTGEATSTALSLIQLSPNSTCNSPLASNDNSFDAHSKPGLIATAQAALRHATGADLQAAQAAAREDLRAEQQARIQQLQHNSQVLMIAASGDNSTSQCGGPPSANTADDNTTRRFVAIGAGGRGASIAQLCCGSFFTACLTVSGEVYLWGDNSHGQCCVGSALQKRGPVQAAPNKILFRGNKILQVACGATFVIALTEGDRVLGWGSVQLLGVGPGADTAPSEQALATAHIAAAHPELDETERALVASCSTMPCSVAALCGKGICQIACGSFHALALAKSTGAVFAWGLSGNDGRLGLGGGGGGGQQQQQLPRVVTTPRRIEPSCFSPVNRVEEICCGARHSAALGAGGTLLWLWGNNSCGQCGVDADSSSGIGSVAASSSSAAKSPMVATPQRVRIPKPQRTPIVSLACGENRTCALFADGDVLVWGATLAFAVGHSNGVPIAVRDSGVFGVPQLLAPQTCAVSIAAGGADMVIALGARRELAVLSLGVIPPGGADAALFGARLDLAQRGHVPAPRFPHSAGMLSVAAGGSHSIIAVCSDAQKLGSQQQQNNDAAPPPRVLAYGSGDWGQLGAGGASRRTSPGSAPGTSPVQPPTSASTPTTPSSPSSSAPAPQQLKRQDPGPVALPDSDPSLSLKGVSCGHAFCFALYSASQSPSSSSSSSTVVYFWGNNNHCQSAIAPSSAHPDANVAKFDTPVKVPALSHKGIVQIACGSFFAMALTEGGRVFSWGLFDSCGLGPLAEFDSTSAVMKSRILGGGGEDNNDSSSSSVLTNSLTKESRKVVAHPVRIDSFPRVSSLLSDDDDEDHGNNQQQRGCFIVRVAAGPWHAAALTSRGQVFTWGVGANHRLGMGADDTRTHMRPVLVDIPTRVRDIACGHANTLAITAQESALYVWGDNEFGQCKSEESKKSVPEPVCVVPSGVKCAAVTRSCTTAVLWNGAVIVCGVIAPSAAQQQQQAADGGGGGLLEPISSRGAFVSIQSAAAAVRKKSGGASGSASAATTIVGLGSSMLSMFPVPPPSTALLDDDDDDHGDHRQATGENNAASTSTGAAAESSSSPTSHIRSLHALDVVASTQHVMLVVEVNRPSNDECATARGFASLQLQQQQTSAPSSSSAAARGAASAAAAASGSSSQPPSPTQQQPRGGQAAASASSPRRPVIDDPAI